MRKTNKIILTCAVTGSIHTPSMSPYLPVTAQEIADQAIAAAEAGASVLHMHARNPDGSPSPDPQHFLEFLPQVKERTDAVINITTGGSAAMTLDERLAAPKALRPEVTSFNMGSMNFNFAAAADRVTEWKHEWEKPYVVGSQDRIYSNTFTQMERIARELGEERGVRFEFECYDVGHLYTLAWLVDRGLVKPPFFVQSIFGILGGVGAHPENLDHMVRIADRLFGDDYYLSVLAAGRHQMPFATQSILYGGSVRVGLEDSLFIGRGELATSNAQQVQRIREIATSLGREIATPAEVREMLGTRGGDDVDF